MRLGRSQLSIVIDVQALTTHADSVASMQRGMGNPPRMIRTPDVCYPFQARDEERLQGLVDCWESHGIAAQVVLIPAEVAIFEVVPRMAESHLAGEGESYAERV